MYYNTTNETEIYGQRVGEIGFCSDPNSANSSPSICMCGVEIDNFDGSCTSGSSTGNTLYYTNSLKICSDYLSEGTEVEIQFTDLGDSFNIQYILI